MGGRGSAKDEDVIMRGYRFLTANVLIMYHKLALIKTKGKRGNEDDQKQKNKKQRKKIENIFLLQSLSLS